MERYVVKFFKSQYQNPLIERGIDKHLNKFPKLEFYNVVEKERLVEDPLVPDGWLSRPKRIFTRPMILIRLWQKRKLPREVKRRPYNMPYHL